MSNTESFSVVEQVQLMVREGKLSDRSSRALLRAAQGPDSADLEDPAFLHGQPSAHSGILLAAAATAKLHVGLSVDDDARLKALIEGLDAQWGVEATNLSALTGCDVDDIRQAAVDPGKLSSEVKYRLAVRVSYIAGAFDSLA